MRKITDIYAEYKIPETLAQHMFRVAGICSWITESWHGPEIDKEKIVCTALLHDIGNILKFDFSPEHSPFPFTPLERAYWEGVKREYQEKYGTDPHTASEKIILELGNPYELASVIGALGFRNTPRMLAQMDYVSMIVQYADMRVSPHAVQSVAERLADFYKRYEHKKDFEALYPERTRAQEAIYEIEKIILGSTNEKLISLQENDIETIIYELKNFSL